MVTSPIEKKKELMQIRMVTAETTAGHIITNQSTKYKVYRSTECRNAI